MLSFRHALLLCAAAGALGLAALPFVRHEKLSIPEPAAATPPNAVAPAVPAATTSPLEAQQDHHPALREALAAYRAGEMDKGDTLVAGINDPVARLMLDWISVQKERCPASLPRVLAFLAAHSDWPARAALERRVEEIIVWDKTRTSLAATWFAQHVPQSAAGRLALARTERAAGKEPQARMRVATLWRTEELSNALETQVLKEFADVLTPADHKARAMRLGLAGKSAALRAAELVGNDVTALVKARLAVVNEAASDLLMQAVPEGLRKDPLWQLSEAQRLRRKGEAEAAAKIIEAAPRDRAALIDPDEWWTERRVLARKLLDEKKPQLAYLLAAHHSAVGREQFIEAEFHAGWIALRFLNDATTAMLHFARAAQRAETPISRARAAYWQGRATEAQGRRDEARGFYEQAAKDQTAYYGQLAREKLNLPPAPLRKAKIIAKGHQRLQATRVIELLYALDETENATTLAIDTARTLTDEAQLAALTALAETYGDPRTSLAIGKHALQRGITLETAAFPTSGIPAFEPAPGSAPMPVVHAIARQESAFHPRALSPAGAKGLMQMIDSTAQHTAKQIGVTFEKTRMLDEPAYNAKLGAAHLGQLLNEFRGSHILTFVAYNAGPRRAREWIAAYGDPRDVNVDTIDWVERIPFSETRNYVQRVMENLDIYMRLAGQPGTSILKAELRTAEQKL